MADRYWVGGNANWDATAGTKWATTSGGAGGAAVPTSSDNVFFDANSGAVTVTIPSYTALCTNIDFTGFTGTFTSSSGVGTINCAGNITLVSGMTMTYKGGWIMSATATGKTITSAGKALISTATNVNFDFNGSGGGWTFQDAFSMTGGLLIKAGTVDFGDQDGSVRFLSMQGTGTKVVNLTSSEITWTGARAAASNDVIAQNTTNLTLNEGTSKMILTGSGNGTIFKCWINETFYDIQMTTPSGSPSTSRFFGGQFSCHDLTILGAYVGTTPVVDQIFCQVTDITTTITVSGALTITGASQRSPITIIGQKGNVAATYQLIANGTIALTDVNFHHMTLGGTATWSGTRVGDAGQNTGLTPTAARNLYWIGNGGSFQDNSHWSLTSGGASATTYPLPQDLCLFDANSFSSGSQTVEMNNAYVPSMRWTGVTNTPALKFDSTASGGYDLFSNSIWVGDEYTFVAGMTINDTNFEFNNIYVSHPPSGTTTLTMGGKSLPNQEYWEANNALYLGDGHMGRIVFADDMGDSAMTFYNDSGLSITIAAGITVTTNDFDLNTTLTPYVYTPSHVIHGTIALKGSGGQYNDIGSDTTGASSTSYATTTTGKILVDTDTGTSFILVFQSNTVANILRPTVYVQGTTATSIEIRSSAHFARVEKKPDQSNPALKIDNVIGAVIDQLIWDGKAGALSSINSDDGASQAELTITADRAVSYCTVTHIDVTGSLRAVNCTDGGNNSGITFETYLSKVGGA